MWISNTATTAMMIPIVDAIAQVSVEGDANDEEDPEDPQRAPLASEDPSNADTEPMVEYNVVDTGNKQGPVALVQVGKKTSKYFMSETQKKAKIERQRNLLLMAVAYSANIGGTGVITGSPPNLVVPQVSIFNYVIGIYVRRTMWLLFLIRLRNLISLSMNNS